MSGDGVVDSNKVCISSAVKRVYWHKHAVKLHECGLPKVRFHLMGPGMGPGMDPQIEYLVN